MRAKLWLVWEWPTQVDVSYKASLDLNLQNWSKFIKQIDVSQRLLHLSVTVRLERYSVHNLAPTKPIANLTKKLLQADVVMCLICKNCMMQISRFHAYLQFILLPHFEMLRVFVQFLRKISSGQKTLFFASPCEY